MAGGLAHGRRRRGVTAESHSEQQPLSILCLLPNAVVPSGWLAVGSDSGRGAERVGYVPMAPSHQGSRASTSMKNSAAFCQWLYSIESLRAWEQGKVYCCLAALSFSTCKDWRGRMAFPLFWDLAATRIKCNLSYISSLFPAELQRRKGAVFVLQVLRKCRFCWRVPGAGSPVEG